MKTVYSLHFTADSFRQLRLGFTVSFQLLAVSLSESGVQP